MNIDKWSFGLNGIPFDKWDTKKFAKQVTTKTWVRKHKKELNRHHDKLTRSLNDDQLVQVVGGILQSAFGVNIGRQVEQLMSIDDFKKFRKNYINNC